MALLYNDVSVLENHHSAIAFKILAQSECNVLAPLTTADRREVRKLIIGAILATDMANHQSWSERIGSHLRARQRAGFKTPFDSSNSDHRELLLAALIKLCDISNVFKDTALADLWMHRITEEYYSQGDEMRRRQMPVPQMFDSGATRPRQEITIGFIAHLVTPFFEQCIAPILSDVDAKQLRHSMQQNEAALRSAAMARK